MITLQLDVPITDRPETFNKEKSFSNQEGQQRQFIGRWDWPNFIKL